MDGLTHDRTGQEEESRGKLKAKGSKSPIYICTLLLYILSVQFLDTCHAYVVWLREVSQVGD